MKSKVFVRVVIFTCLLVLGGIFYPFSSTTNAVIIPDFQVNPPDTAFIPQLTTDIAFQKDGKFVIVWEDRGKAHDNRQIYFQCYDSLGNAIGSVVQVSDNSTGYLNQGCALAVDSAGNFAICYSSAKYAGVDTTSGEDIFLWDIWVRLYSPQGQPLTPSMKVDLDRPDPVQDPGGYSEQNPHLGMHESGKFVVAWAEEIFSDTVYPLFLKRIYCQFFTSSGDRIGNNIWVSEPDPDTFPVNNTLVRVAITQNEYVLFCWEGNLKRPDGYVTSFPLGRLYSLSGQSLGSAFPIISPSDSVWRVGGFPDLSATPGNDFVVACYSGNYSYPNNTIVVLRVDTLGNPLNRPQSVVDTTDIGDPFTMPRVDIGQEGYVVIWSDKRTGDRNLMAQRFNYNDQPIGVNYRINAVTGSLNSPPDPIFGERLGNWRFYDLDIDDHSKVGISWSDYRNYVGYEADIYAKIFDFNEIGLYMSGDLNQDGQVNLADLISLVNYVFKGGVQPFPLFVADVTADCKVNLADIIYLVNYIFKSGAAPKQGCA